MAQVLGPDRLTAVVNTGDDFVHWGLAISPDLDTCMYTLAGLADEARGWGLRDETFQARAAMARYGAPGWFSLGDSDLATHLLRSQALAANETLTAITQRLCERLGVAVPLLPMCDAARNTVLETFDVGTLPFQEWLVKHGAPRVRAVRYQGETQATARVYAALESADLIVLGPSNPYVSIDPILTLSGVRARIQHKKVVALSPIVNGKAVKGPLADMIRTLARVEPSAQAIAAHYRGLLTGLVVEHGDPWDDAQLALYETRTVMGEASDRKRLAEELLTFCESLP
jgi:LPPG:FO 2-phospho-L-lactate transferase